MHFRTRPDGALMRHGGKVKGSECSGSLARPPVVLKRMSLGNAGNLSIKKNHVVLALKCDMADEFFSRSANFCLHDHLPKQCRPKFSQVLAKVLKEIIKKPLSPPSWYKLLFLPSMVLRRSPRRGKRHNPTGVITQRLDAFGGCSVERMVESLEPVVKYSKKVSTEAKMISSVRSKIEKGNIRNALQLLSTAIQLQCTAIQLHRKECLLKEASSLTVNSQQVLHCLKSFPKGTSGGRDGLTPAHLRDVTSSKADSSDLVNLIASFVNLILSGNCPPEVASILFGGRLKVFDGFRTVHGAGICIETRSQKEWNAPFISSSVAKLLDLNQSNFDKARIMAVKSELGSSWLKAVPNSACGTRLDDSCVRVSLGLRLGLPILTEYVCLCGANVEPLGYHGLSGRLGPGRQAPHSAMNDFLVRCFQRANIPTIKEPTGFMEEGSLRPDGYTISPWAQKRSLAWDVTFPHTMAKRYINLISQEAGAAALRAADFNKSKYAALAESKIFQPVCIETFGPTDAQTQSFLNELCSRIVEVSGDPLDKSYESNPFLFYFKNIILSVFWMER
ncbi:hypothetical protein HELRODRAFT_161132 [Helobdella robusta]|uniref:Uncharacterized protein n=1 Tax=Helobdella robusta TaxID=6412 RepID=T1ER46_HELRO|nr:hypothetical protein HELRODRAFT_161132 [Helobdella robusta]ESO01930.1 hypothetical protein HELRODRAFT_161132 [Helobdella robusta]